MPKTRSGKCSRPTDDDDEKETILTEAVAQLEQQDDDAVVLIGERLGVENAEPRRQEWLGCMPLYSVSGTSDAASTAAAAEAPTADSPPLGEDDAAAPPEVAETTANNA